MRSAVRRIKLGSQRARGNLGTFPGVFTPSVLTILGIILFLRLGYIVGSTGLRNALIIIGLANVISILTSVSLAAIATNLKVKVGGPYYLISRTLGMEFGGAIGIVLFLAQSISVAFYCLGLGEAVASILPEASEAHSQTIAAVAIIFLLIFAWLGADWATRLQYVVMSMLGVALLSFFVGGVSRFDGTLLIRNWAGPAAGPPFWILFAIFFPAVTGFTQGVSMSGDLKDASKSITTGTFAAVGISIVIYLSTAIIFAAAMPGEDLSRDYEAMKHVAGIGWLIDMGVIAATLSSAMASLLGAPRILQSLAQDRVFPFLMPFAQGAGPNQNPRRGIVFSAGIALAAVGLGKLNLIAPVVSMFFLISYGLLNYATFYEARGSSPSFRPTFRWFHYRLCLLGALGCLGVMVAIDLVSSAIAVAILFGIHQYLQRTAGPARWADSKRSYHFQIMREHLFGISAEPEHPRDWRPQVLAFSDDAHRRKNLLRFAGWIAGNSGLTTVVRILVGEGKRIHEQRAAAEAELGAEIAELGLRFFAKVVAVPDFGIGAQTLFQSYGIGPIQANTVLVNGPEQLLETKDPEGQRQYGRYLSGAFRLGSNIVILNALEERWSFLEGLPPQDRRIDVWWLGDATSRLMLLFAYLMTRDEGWSESRIRVLAATEKRATKRDLESLRMTLEDVRISAEPQILVKPSIDTIVEQSTEAAFVFLPLHVRKNRLVSPLSASFDSLVSRLPLAAFVIAAEDIELEAEPEEGKPAEIAAALDAAADAEKFARKLEKEAAEASKQAEEKRRALQEAVEKSVSRDKLSEIRKVSRETEKLAEKAAQKAEKARTEADEAAESAEGLRRKPEKGNSEA